MKLSQLQKGLVAQYKLDSNSKSVSGAELVTNGTFDSDTTGWGTANSATLASVAGGYRNNCLQITNGAAAFGYTYSTALTTVVGQTYSITYAHKSGTSGAARLAIGTTNANADLYDTGYTLNDTNWTRYTATFTATTTTSYIRLINGTSTINQTTFFDEITVKAVSVLDSTPYSNNGTVWGGITIGGATDEQGQAGRATSLDGVSDYISIPDATQLNPGSLFSVFIMAKGTNTIGTVIGQYDYTAGKRSWRITGTVDNKMTVWVDELGNTVSRKVYTTNSVVFDNNWHLIGFTWNSGILKLYVDGVEVAVSKGQDSTFTTIYNADVPVTIGTSLSNGSAAELFPGSVNNARIYNRDLTAIEVSQLYNSYRPKIAESTLQKGLVLDVSLDSITKAKDKTPYLNNGTGAGGITIGGTTDEKGIANMATAFDGLGNYISGSIPTALGTGDYSISLRFKDAGATFYMLSPSTNVTGDYPFPHIRVQYASNVIWIQNKASGGTASIPFTPDGAWHTLVWIRTSGILTAYLDGVVKTVTSNDTQSGYNFTGTGYDLGDFYYSGTRYYSAGTLRSVKFYNRALTSTEAIQLSTQYRPKLAQSSLQKGLVLDTTLDAITGAKDRTPYLNNGSIANVTLGDTADRLGITGKATAFNGTSSEVDISDSTSLSSPTTDISVSIWFKKTGAGTGVTPGIISKRNDGWGLIWVLAATNALSSRIYQSNGSQTNPDPITILDNTWYHFVLTANSTEQKVRTYLNGVQQGNGFSYDGTLKTGSSAITIGQQSSSFFQGVIGTTKIWNRALTQTEITSLYNNYQ